MDIALHLGVHLTDDGQLRGCLQANKRILAEQGIAVPRSRSFQNLFRAAANDLTVGETVPDFATELCAAVGASAATRRLICSTPALLCTLPEALEHGVLYPGAAARLAAYRTLLSAYPTEIFLAIRNPASFVPALLAELEPSDRGAILSHLRLDALRWSVLVQDIRKAWPEAPITVWCDEDTPFLWHRLLRLLSGHKPHGEFDNSFDWFNSVMIAGGAEKLEAYLRARPNLEEEFRHQIISAFLDKFGDDEKLDVDVSLAGWDAAQLDAISELYEQDVAFIAQMPGLRFLQP
jgi:hypothetical protein